MSRLIFKTSNEDRKIPTENPQEIPATKIVLEQKKPEGKMLIFSSKSAPSATVPTSVPMTITAPSVSTAVSTAVPTMSIQTTSASSSAASASFIPTVDINRGSEIYNHYSDIDHVFHVQGMYIGSIEQIPREEWLYDSANSRIVQGTISVSEGMERVYIEPLSNASDNAGESRRAGIDPGQIEVTMTTTSIKIKNYGLPIPIELHKPTGKYAPELIFGTLRTSGNYKPERHGAGVNGLGVKITNIFSKHFGIVIHDSVRHKKYTQHWKNNMKDREECTIEEYDGRVSSVEIESLLDFNRFNCPNGFPPECFALYARHCADISFTAKLPVIFNGVKFDLGDVRNYAKLYFGESVTNYLVHYEWPAGTEIIKHRGGYQTSKNPSITPLVELCVLDTPDNSVNISFVNCMMTRDGGVHVNTAVKVITSNIIDTVNSSTGYTKQSKKTKGKPTKTTPDEKKKISINVNDVKPHISMVLSVKLMNPSFKGQTKNTLSSPIPKFVIDDRFLEPIMKWQLVNRLYAALDAKHFHTLSKSDGKKRRHVNVAKLEPANKAGTNESDKCMLFLVEGDSATSYPIKFISYTDQGRDYLGYLPLKGKVLNVMNAKLQRIIDNSEIQSIKETLGLREGVDYTQDENYRNLNYGRIMILTDADVDGVHIAGLLLNLFYCRYPSLLARGYIMMMMTPIIRLNKGNQTLKFYTEFQYEQWCLQNNSKNWNVSYFKGLGRSQDKDIKDDHKAPRTACCIYDDRTPEAMKLAFDEKLADARKEWMATWQRTIDVQALEMIPISAFLKDVLIQHALYNMRRSIPCIMDNLKLSQRKIMWAMFNKWKNLDGKKKEIKVMQLTAGVLELNYKHGEKSVNDAIVTMAQSFTGSNNLPQIFGVGQYGCLYTGGGDKSDTRYLYCAPEWWLSYVYRKEDLDLVPQQIDEDLEVEPPYLLPIICMQLVNGSRGIGTGSSTFIPNHNPLDVIRWLRAKASGSTEFPELIPWYKDFNGSIEIKDLRAKCGKKDVPNTDLLLNPDESFAPDISDDSKEESSVDPQEDKEDHLEKIKQKVAAEDHYEKLVESHKYSMVTTGSFELYGGGVVEVTMLPIGRWGKDYKDWLNSLLKDKEIADFKSNCKDDSISFTIWGFKGPSIKSLRLQKSYGLGNMTLLDMNQRPRKYDTARDIIEEFYRLRLPFYGKRKQKIMDNIQMEISKMTHRIKFIELVLDGTIEVKNHKKDYVKAILKDRGIPEEHYTKSKITHLSQDDIYELKTKINKKVEELNLITNVKIETLWINDLNEFEVEYLKHYPEKTKVLEIRKKNLDIKNPYISTTVKNAPKVQLKISPEINIVPRLLIQNKPSMKIKRVK